MTAPLRYSSLPNNFAECQVKDWRLWAETWVWGQSPSSRTKLETNSENLPRLKIPERLQNSLAGFVYLSKFRTLNFLENKKSSIQTFWIHSPGESSQCKYLGELKSSKTWGCHGIWWWGIKTLFIQNFNWL